MKLETLSLMVFALLLLSTACGKSQGEDTVAATTVATVESVPATAAPQAPTATLAPLAQKSQSGSFFAINEIGLGPEGYVALTNFTGVPVSLGGLYLCQGGDCFALPDEVVEGDETVQVAAGDGEGLQNVIATEATYGELRPADGEIALFKSEQTDDPQALLVYLQWGSSPHGLTDVAVEAGLWVGTSFAPTSPNATRLFRVPESGLWLFDE